MYGPHKMNLVYIGERELKRPVLWCENCSGVTEIASDPSGRWLKIGEAPPCPYSHDPFPQTPKSPSPPPKSEDPEEFWNPLDVPDPPQNAAVAILSADVTLDERNIVQAVLRVLRAGGEAWQCFCGPDTCALICDAGDPNQYNKVHSWRKFMPGGSCNTPPQKATKT